MQILRRSRNVPALSSGSCLNFFPRCLDFYARLTPSIFLTPTCFREVTGIYHFWRTVVFKNSMIQLYMHLRSMLETMTRQSGRQFTSPVSGIPARCRESKVVTRLSKPNGQRRRGTCNVMFIGAVTSQARHEERHA